MAKVCFQPTKMFFFENIWNLFQLTQAKHYYRYQYKIIQYNFNLLGYCHVSPSKNTSSNAKYKPHTSIDVHLWEKYPNVFDRYELVSINDVARYVHRCKMMMLDDNNGDDTCQLHILSSLLSQIGQLQRCESLTTVLSEE